MKEGYVRVGPLTVLPDLLDDLGSDSKAIFSSCGFNAAEFANPDYEISYTEVSKLLARCVEKTGCNHLGLLIGERADPLSLGMTGFLTHSAPDVRTALRSLVQYLELHDRGAKGKLVANNGTCALCYEVQLTGMEAIDQIYDHAPVFISKILKLLCGEGWKPIEIQFSRPAPSDLEPYQRIFNVPIRFDADHTCVIFSEEWLDQSLASSNPYLHQHLKREAHELLEQENADLLDQIRQCIRDSLESRTVSATRIAKRLGMHERTMSRHLGNAGTSFREEVSAVRYDLSRRLLEDARMPLSKIASRLGYANVSGFCRAFKEWSGYTPSKWRALGK